MKKILILLLFYCLVGLAFSSDLELCDSRTIKTKASCHNVSKDLADKTQKCCWIEQKDVTEGKCGLVNPSKYLDYWKWIEETTHTKVTSLDCFSKHLEMKRMNFTKNQYCLRSKPTVPHTIPYIKKK